MPFLHKHGFGSGGMSLTDKTTICDAYNSKITSDTDKLGYNVSYGTATPVSLQDKIIVSQSYSLTGNGGRKLVRTASGRLLLIFKNGTTGYILRASMDNGNTWSSSLTQGASGITDVSVVSVGKYVYITVASGTGVTCSMFREDSTYYTWLNSYTLDSSQTATGTTTTVYNPKDNSIHFAWSSTNSSYGSCYNIRYTRATVNADNTLTLGSKEQITSLTGSDHSKNPSITVKDNVPYIFFDQVALDAFAHALKVRYKPSTTWSEETVHQVGTGYNMGSASAMTDKNGKVWVTWKTAGGTNQTYTNIYVGASTTGTNFGTGIQELTKVTTAHQTNPSLTSNRNGDIFIVYEGTTPSTGYDVVIKYLKSTNNGSSWTESYFQPVVGVDVMDLTVYYDDTYNLQDFSVPLCVYKVLEGTSYMGFTGTWNEQTVTAGINYATVSDDKLANTVVTKALGAKRFVEGTTTSSSTTTTYYGNDGSTANLNTLTVTGLTFKPSFILIISSSGLRGTIYTATHDAFNYNNAKVFAYGSAGTSTTLYNFKCDGKVTATGFSLPVAMSATSLKWIAYE